MTTRALVLALPLLLALPAAAQSGDTAAGSSGTVELPRDVYDQLVAAGQLPPEAPRKAPVAWSPGTATVVVKVADDGAVTIDAVLQVRVLEDQWTRCLCYLWVRR